MSQRKVSKHKPRGAPFTGPDDPRICHDKAKQQEGMDKRSEWQAELDYKLAQPVPDGGGSGLQRLAENLVTATLVVSEELANGQANLATVQLFKALAESILPYISAKRQAVELSGPGAGPTDIHTDIHYDARIVSPLAEAGK